MLVRTLLLHGCPIPAVVAAFGLDERTVRAWLHKAGAHAALRHDQMGGGVEARPVQADAMRGRVRGGAVWAAIALDVGSRLWLATALARRRAGLLVHLLRRRTRAALAGRAFLLAVDGVARYIGGARSLVRVPERTGRQGRPRVVWPDRRGSRLPRWSRPGCTTARGACGASSGGRRRWSPPRWSRAMAARPSTRPPARGSTPRYANAALRWAGAPSAHAHSRHGPRRGRAAPAAAGRHLVRGPRGPAPARHRHGAPLGRADARAGRRARRPSVLPR